MTWRAPEPQLTWDYIEQRWPGSSATWDVVAIRFKGEWQIDSMYLNYFDRPVVFVSGPDAAAYWIYEPEHGTWFRT